MKILFDIVHPAAVHYFKGLIKLHQAAGHRVIITARNKDITHQLLRHYGFSFIDMGNMKRSIFSKIIFQILGEFKALLIIGKHRPDIVVSMGTINFAHASFFWRRPYISFDDTEHTQLNRFFYSPFATRIFTPKYFTKDLGKKQVRLNGVFELFYLHPLQLPKWRVKLPEGGIQSEKFAIVRFISWDAFHDIGVKTGSYDKMDIIHLVSKYMKVYVSMEGDVPPELASYVLKIPPEALHSYLEMAEIYIGEGATTASEAAMLGTPSVYLNPLQLGYITAEENWGLLWDLGKDKHVLQSIQTILDQPELKKTTQEKLSQILPGMPDPTSFFFKYLSNFPESDQSLPDCINCETKC